MYLTAGCIWQQAFARPPVFAKHLALETQLRIGVSTAVPPVLCLGNVPPTHRACCAPTSGFTSRSSLRRQWRVPIHPGSCLTTNRFSSSESRKSRIYRSASRLIDRHVSDRLCSSLQPQGLHHAARRRRRIREGRTACFPPDLYVKARRGCLSKDPFV